MGNFTSCNIECFKSGALQNSIPSKGESSNLSSADKRPGWGWLWSGAPKPHILVMNLLSWNVRVFNRPSMHLEIRCKIHQLHLIFVGLTETRVRKSNIDQVNSFLPSDWRDANNSHHCETTRIWAVGALLSRLTSLKIRLSTFIVKFCKMGTTSW